MFSFTRKLKNCMFCTYNFAGRVKHEHRARLDLDKKSFFVLLIQCSSYRWNIIDQRPRGSYQPTEIYIYLHPIGQAHKHVWKCTYTSSIPGEVRDRHMECRARDIDKTLTNKEPGVCVLGDFSLNPRRSTYELITCTRDCARAMTRE